MSARLQTWTRELGTVRRKLDGGEGK
jgi:hypothetical protein